MPAALASGVIFAFGPPMSVFTKPGWTSRTVMPSRFSASAAIFITLLTAPFDEQYAYITGIGNAIAPIWLVIVTARGFFPAARFLRKVWSMRSGAMVLTA